MIRKNIPVFILVLLLIVTVSSYAADDRTISELATEEIAKYANFAWVRYKMNPISGRLLYHSLLQDFNNPRLLGVMSDVLVEEIPELSAVVFEYIYSSNIQMDAEEKRYRDAMYASAMWMWGLSRTKSGEQSVQLGAFYNDPYQFIYDEEGFQELIEPIIELAGGLENAVRGVHTFMGLCGGILEKKGGSEKWSPEELFDSNNFSVTEEYQKWLMSSVKELEEMMDYDHEFKK